MSVDTMTRETIAAIKKAQTAGVNTSTGITGIDLSDLISQIPVNTPFRDQVPRTRPKMGAKFAEWRVLVNVNNSQPNPFTAFDYAAPLVQIEEMDVTALYAKIGMGYTVTQDAIDQAGGYADAKAVTVFGTLNQFKIGEDKGGIGGCLFALNTPATPAVADSPTGGSIPPSTVVDVKVAARTGANYFWGGSTVASAQGAVTTSTVTGSTHSAVATVTAVRGAMAYDWYVAGFYYTTTVVNVVTITSVPTANATSVPKLPGLYATAPTAVPTVDSSAGANQFNGLLATLAGDYAEGGATGLVTPGSGVPSGAYFHSLDGAAFTVDGAAVEELDNMNQAIFDTVELSPDAYMMSSRQGTELSNVILNSTNSETFFQPNLAGRSEAVLGAFVGWYVNKAAGGTPIRVEVHPHLPPGTLIARTDTVPWPNSEITNTLEMRCVKDLADYEYAANRNSGVAGGGPRFDGETYANETLINKAPVAMGVLQNIL
jgi:hypothetical protein